MSTFAVFGMTAGVALAEARKITRTSRLPTQGLTLPEWNAAVEKTAAKIMAGKKVKQLSQLFDAPQYAEQFIVLARKTGECRDLRIRAKCEITDAEGKPVINQKTKMPRVGWCEYQPEPSEQVAYLRGAIELGTCYQELSQSARRRNPRR
ncbi:hypothetical protein [Pseudomonas tussilaginis]|uniref:hypothetical protein n=1 Tax=Pseudomonas putida TaxID=303 RepID=UPI0023635771|nr:hypothetical protein [Pseudomonas putida]MDD1976969.1 hypothetical protein [Pseudomonas putida]